MPAQPKTITLTPDLRDALGLDGCQPGDTYTIQVQAKDGSDGDAQSFDVLSSLPDSADADQPPTDSTDDGAPPDSEEPPLPPGPDDTGDDESKILGYSRKKKAPREGLPDTKKLRDLV